MYKNVEMAARAALRFAQEPRAVLLERGNTGGEIGHTEGDVMQAFTALGEEAADDGVLFGWFQKFDARAAGGKHGDVYFLMRNSFARGHAEPELLLVELQRPVDGADGDAQVIDVNLHGATH